MIETVKENTNLKVALGYTRHLGWAVFPVHAIINGDCTCGDKNCSSKGKHPAVPNGFKEATKDERKIIKWWTDRPLLNIGVATGEISGFFAFDIDTKIHKGTGMTGFEALNELENRYGELPPTPQQITGSGGMHYLFKFKEGIKNRGNIFPSIDIRGEGGYIIVHPSIHESGREYEWEISSRPSEIELADAPNWLINPITNKYSKDKLKKKPSNEYVRILQGVEKGERNNALMILIGHLFSKKIDYRIAFEIVHIWNELRVYPPLDRNTVTTAFNNILKNEVEKSGG